MTMAPPTGSTTNSCEQIRVASIATPPGRKASIGVVVTGMDLGDLRAVKRFAAAGFVAMQIRLIPDSAHHKDLQRRYATYDESGVARCRQALDMLSDEYGVQHFILMGGCALANVCFNTAEADPRVAGLILTNPYIGAAATSAIPLKLRKHLFQRRSWLRLLSGSMKLLRGATHRIGSRGEADRQRVTATYHKDMALPGDFDRCLKALSTDRPMQTLLVFSQTELSLHYFRRHYRRTIDELVAAGKLHLEVLPFDNHDLSARDDSALGLNNLITEWTRKCWSTCAT